MRLATSKFRQRPPTSISYLSIVKLCEGAFHFVAVPLLVVHVSRGIRCIFHPPWSMPFLAYGDELDKARPYCDIHVPSIH